MTLNLRRYDTAEYLRSREDINAYVDAIKMENDPQLLAYSIGVVARAKSFLEITNGDNSRLTALYNATLHNDDYEYELDNEDLIKLKGVPYA